MSTIAVLITSVLALAVTIAPGAALAWTRSPATRFATLPDGFANPERIAADAAGNLYVTTFDTTKTGGPGQLFVFTPSGRLLRQVAVEGSSNLLLDLAFHPQSGALLVIDFASARVLTVDPVTGASQIFAQIPGSAGPNVLTFDRAGNVYVSDSFQATVWRTGPAGGMATPFVTSPLLGTSGVPPFGANGLAFDTAQTALFVANTGNDTVIRIPVSGTPLAAGTPAVFANSVNGADGLIVDEDDNVWVCANQADEVVVLDRTGRLIAKLGDFGGIGPDGAPNGLLFPASLVRSGNFVYVTNLALDLRLFDPDFTTGDSPWTSEVRRHTIARIGARIPPVQRPE